MGQYGDLSYRELRSLAKERELKFNGTPTKPTILDRLRADDAAAEADAREEPLTVEAELAPEPADTEAEPTTKPDASVKSKRKSKRKRKRKPESDARVLEVGHDEYIGKGPKRYRVLLKHLRPLVVAVADDEGEAEAWECYRCHLGVVATDHQPDVVEV